MPALWVGVVTGLLLTLGLAGIVIPGAPGIGLIFAGIVFYGLMTDFASISVTTVVVLGILTVVAWLADWGGAVIGTKVGGGGMKSLGLMLAGGVIGLLSGGPLGLVLGVFVGALIGALWEGKTGEAASKAALLAVVGMLAATVVQLVLGVSMVVAFVLALVF